MNCRANESNIKLACILPSTADNIQYFKCYARAPITITDINCEISDAANATNSIKFKYKYSSHHLPITIDYGNNIFDDPFHRIFD